MAICDCEELWFHDTLDPEEVMKLDHESGWTCPVCYHKMEEGQTVCTNCHFGLVEEQLFIQSHIRWHRKKEQRENV